MKLGERVRLGFLGNRRIVSVFTLMGFLEFL